MTIWPASVPVSVELCPAHSSATPNRIGAALPRNDGSSLCASSMRRDLQAVAVEDRGAQDQDRRVDEERGVQGDRRVDQVVPAGRPPCSPTSVPIRRVCTRAEWR